MRGGAGAPPATNDFPPAEGRRTGGVRGGGSPPATNDFPLAEGRRTGGGAGWREPPRPMMIQKRPKGEALGDSPPANGRPAGGVQGGQRPPAQNYHILRRPTNFRRPAGGAGGSAPRPMLLHSPPANKFQAASRWCGGAAPPRTENPLRWDTTRPDFLKKLFFWSGGWGDFPYHHSQN